MAVGEQIIEAEYVGLLLAGGVQCSAAASLISPCNFSLRATLFILEGVLRGCRDGLCWLALAPLAEQTEPQLDPRHCGLKYYPLETVALSRSWTEADGGAP